MGPGTFRDFSEPKPETGGKIQHIQYHFKSPILPSALCQQNIFCQSLLLLLKGKSVKKVMDQQYNHFKWDCQSPTTYGGRLKIFNSYFLTLGCFYYICI